MIDLRRGSVDLRGAALGLSVAKPVVDRVEFWFFGGKPSILCPDPRLRPEAVLYLRVVLVAVSDGTTRKVSWKALSVRSIVATVGSKTEGSPAKEARL